MDDAIFQFTVKEGFGLDDVSGQLIFNNSLIESNPSPRDALSMSIQSSDILPISYVLAAGMGFLGFHRFFRGKFLSAFGMLFVSMIGLFSGGVAVSIINAPMLTESFWEVVACGCFVFLSIATFFDLVTMHGWID